MYMYPGTRYTAPNVQYLHYTTLKCCGYISYYYYANQPKKNCRFGLPC